MPCRLVYVIRLAPTLALPDLRRSPGLKPIIFTLEISQPALLSGPEQCHNLPCMYCMYCGDYYVRWTACTVVITMSGGLHVLW